jgi:hypothetical protein
MPIDHQTWRKCSSASGIQALREFPGQALEFPCDVLAPDPRIAA